MVVIGLNGSKMTDYVSLCGPFRKNDVCYVIKKYKMKSYSKPWKTGKRVRLIKPKVSSQF